MKLYVLKPVKGAKEWDPWYDKVFGLVVRARNEKQARHIAAHNCGDEGPEVWWDQEKTDCKMLFKKGEACVIIKDLASS